MEIAHVTTTTEQEQSEAEWQYLYATGFYGLSWDPLLKTVEISFCEGEWSWAKLWPNRDESEYRCIYIPDSWQERGMEALWITFEGHKSVIHVLMTGHREPLICTKFYN